MSKERGDASNALDRTRRRILYATGVALALVVGLPYFLTGWSVDEIFITGSSHANHPWMNSAWDAFRFSSGVPSEVQSHIAEGSFPWWTMPAWKYALWRPLTSLLLAFDHAVFGHEALGYKIHTLAWYVFLVVAAGAVFRRTTARLTAGPRVALLATIVFAISRSHLEVVRQHTCRHHSIGIGFALLALWAHVRWREDGWRRGRALSVVFAVIGLASGEAALSGLVYLLAYEITADRAWRDRLRALVPCLTTIGLYIALYKLLGRGMYGGGSHFDPFEDPAAFLGHAPRRLLVFLLSLASGGALDPNPVLLAAPFAVVLMVLGYRAAGPEERRTLRGYGLGALLALAPQLGGDLGDRNVLGATVGVDLLLATGLIAAWAFVRKRSAGFPLRRVLFGALAAPIALLHLAFPLWSLWEDAAERRQRAVYLDALLLGPQPFDGDGNVVMLGGPEFATGQLLGFLRWHRGGKTTRSWNVISPACAGTIHRTGARTFEFETTDRSRSFFRNTERYPMKVGTVVRQAMFEATVLAVEGGVARKVAYRFDVPLDDPNLYFVTVMTMPEMIVKMPPDGGTLELTKCFPDYHPVDLADRMIDAVFEDL